MYNSNEMYIGSVDSFVNKTVDISRERAAAHNRSSVVELAAVRLNLIIGRMKIAYSGNRVDWSDTGGL